MNIIVKPNHTVSFGSETFTCTLGPRGILPAVSKREGDGATPAGLWPLREVFYRSDRLSCPQSVLATTPLTQNDGWCDDPSHKLYNKLISRPFEASHEQLWREDHLYDIVVVLGFNDNPPEKGCGSAIFLHIAAPDMSPTRGCVGLKQEDLLAVMRAMTPDTQIEILSDE